METYRKILPGAKFIFTYRNFNEIIASLCSLMHYVSIFLSWHQDLGSNLCTLSLPYHINSLTDSKIAETSFVKYSAIFGLILNYNYSITSWWNKSKSESTWLLFLLKGIKLLFRWGGQIPFSLHCMMQPLSYSDFFQIDRLRWWLVQNNTFHENVTDDNWFTFH